MYMMQDLHTRNYSEAKNLVRIEENEEPRRTSPGMMLVIGQQEITQKDLQ